MFALISIQLMIMEIENKIINLFILGFSMRKIERELNCSFFKVQKTIKSFEFEKKINYNYPLKENYNIVAKCKKTNRILTDYKNKSGSITIYLKKTYPDIIIPTNYKLKDIEYRTGKFWYDEFFNFEYVKIKDKFKCVYCNWETNDIENNSGAYLKHLISEHNIDIDKYLIEYPNHEIFFKKRKKDVIRKKFLKNDNNNVTCKICNQKFKQINSKHLKKHGITLDEYKFKYNNDINSISTKNKLSNNYEIHLKNKSKIKSSKAEKEISEILNKHNINFVLNKRNIINNEIDIYLPEHKIGIEYNGLYYHSERNGKKNNKYHYNKTKECNDKGISLFHIFEDDWIKRKEIVINKLLYSLNIFNKKKIYARNCIIKEISSLEKNLFLEKYHIQGSDKSNFKIGAYYNNELVAVMTFDNIRSFNKGNNHNKKIYELKRFSTNIDYNVIGIGGKLLEYFKRNNDYEKIISFLDLSWHNINKKNIYNILGFKIDKTLKPDYKYVHFSIHKNERLHKFRFGKEKIKKMFPNIYDKNKTENQMMIECGFDRIWDCGKIRYILNK